MVDLHSDIDELFAQLREVGPVALAVSGGGDSMAMLYLFAKWRKRHPLTDNENLKTCELLPRDVVFSVDHGLRPEAAIEVEQVMAAASLLGFEGRSLKLDKFQDGDGLQSRARSARYEAMSAEMAGIGISHLLTAHTADDQAETFLMRLQRGSGVDGLSAILPQRVLFGVTIVRPLLGVRGADLRSWLRDEGVSWVEDPSNRNDRFERVRVREWLSNFDDNGGMVRGIGESVRRLQKSRLALEAIVDGFLSTHGFVHLYGVIELPLEAFETLSFELQIRVLRRLVLAFGRDEPLLSSLEGWVEHILSMGNEKFAIAGVIVEKRSKNSGVLVLTRETGRAELVELLFRPEDILKLAKEQGAGKGTGSASDQIRIVWDNRIGFEFSFKDYERGAAALSASDGDLKVRGFKSDEIARLAEFMKAEPVKNFPIDLKLLAGVAGFWIDGQLLAVPQLENADEQLVKLCFYPNDCERSGGLEINAKFPLISLKEV